MDAANVNGTGVQVALAAATAFFGGGWLRERRKARRDALAQALEFIQLQTQRIDKLERQVEQLQQQLVDRAATATVVVAAQQLEAPQA